MELISDKLLFAFATFFDTSRMELSTSLTDIILTNGALNLPDDVALKSSFRPLTMDNLSASERSGQNGLL